MLAYSVYILSNYTRSVLYIGYTKDLSRRLALHRKGRGSKFALRYKVKYLVYWEQFDDLHKAKKREKQLKTWHRDWKMRLIRRCNPMLQDLSGNLFKSGTPRRRS